jgi:YesN/AraC family two-component response regulator
MTEYLSKFFLEVVVATNGKEGLERYKEGKFELIVTDLSMPVVNGLEMLEAIKAIEPEQLVLVTSAHSESEYMVGAITAGIDGYIIKPFDFGQLNNELFKIVEKIHIYEENAAYKKNLEKLVEKKTAMLSSLLTFQSDNYEKTIYSMVEMIEEREILTRQGTAKE